MKKNDLHTNLQNLTAFYLFLRLGIFTRNFIYVVVSLKTQSYILKGNKDAPFVNIDCTALRFLIISGIELMIT